jgi:hypothetical protein
MVWDRLGFWTAGRPSKRGFQALMILKMNFNFNFKDMLLRLKPSIRSLTNWCD